MSFIQEDEVARGVIKALKSDEGQQLLESVMARKLETTAGWDCRDAGERAEIRKDMEFIRELRLAARRSFDRAFIWALGIGGMAVVSWLGVKHDWLK